ncbi:TPA: hypothetical protein ACG6BE_000315 [Streptococcus agalactiae]
MSKKTDSNYLHSNCSDKKIWSDEAPLQQETIPKDRDCVIKPVITMTVEHVEIPLDDQSYLSPKIKRNTAIFDSVPFYLTKVVFSLLI